MGHIGKHAREIDLRKAATIPRVFLEDIRRALKDISWPDLRRHQGACGTDLRIASQQTLRGETTIGSAKIIININIQLRVWRVIAYSDQGINTARPLQAPARHGLHFIDMGLCSYQ